MAGLKQSAKNQLLAFNLLFSLVVVTVSDGNTSDGSHSTTLPRLIPQYLEDRPVNLTQGLSVFINRKDSNAQNICFEVKPESEDVIAHPNKEMIQSGDARAVVPKDITFESQSARVNEQLIPVTMSIYSSSSNDECVPSDPEQVNSIIVQLLDDRVIIGWAKEAGTCPPNETCTLSVNIDASHLVPFNLTAAINGKENDTLLVSNISRPINFTFTLEKGEYDATLSISSNITNRVRWSPQTMKLSVKKISTEEKLRALKGQVTSLQTQIEELKQNMARLVHDCIQLNCGEYGTCDIEGSKCNCMYDDVYTGVQCREFVGCERSPDACGAGSRGDCVTPSDPKDKYTCLCRNGSHVQGKDCDECSDDICSGRGSCVVDDNGQPTCKCDEYFTGPTCGDCDDSYCHNRGSCTVAADGEPTCECAEFGDNLRCQACVDDDSVCNGGKCVDGECNCAGTEQIGSLCEYKACTNKCEDGDDKCYFKDGDKTCFCDNGQPSCKEGVVEPPSPTSPLSPTSPPSPLTSSSPPTSSPSPTSPLPPTSPTNPCDPSPCENGGTCNASNAGGGYTCKCLSGYTGDNCEDEDKAEVEEPTSPATPEVTLNRSDNNSQLLYGGLAVFIAILVICVAAYLAYHNREKVFELFGGKKESIVEMAMRSRTKSKGYKKLPTSIHDTLTHGHED